MLKFFQSKGAASDAGCTVLEAAQALASNGVQEAQSIGFDWGPHHAERGVTYKYGGFAKKVRRARVGPTPLCDVGGENGDKVTVPYTLTGLRRHRLARSAAPVRRSRGVVRVVPDAPADPPPARETRRKSVHERERERCDASAKSDLDTRACSFVRA